MSRVRLTIVLQVKDMSGVWSTEQIFESQTEAIVHGKERFPQNEWRVVGVSERGTRVLYEHEPLTEIEIAAIADTNRFRDVERTREIFARIVEIEANRRNLRNIAQHSPGENWDDWDFPSYVGDEKVNWKEEGF